MKNKPHSGAPEADRRKEDKGPSERGLLGRVFDRTKRFGTPASIARDEPEALYDQGDPDFGVDVIGRTRVALGKVYSPEEGRNREEEGRVRRLKDAMEFGRFYYGPQYIKIKPGSELDTEIRKKFRVREGDIIEISPSVKERKARDDAASARPGYEMVYISVKSADGKGQKFFFVDRSIDEKLYGELLSECYRAIDGHGIKLFPHEEEAYRNWRSAFKGKLRAVVNEIGEEEGDYLNVKFSRLAGAFEGTEEGIGLAIPELKKQAGFLVPGKTIRLIDDRSEAQKKKEKLYF